MKLFETIGRCLSIEGLANSSGDEVMALPNDYFLFEAASSLPEIPDDMPFRCNGGTIDLLIHIHFDTRRPDTDLPVVDVLFRVNPGRTMSVVGKAWGPLLV